MIRNKNSSSKELRLNQIKYQDRVDLCKTSSNCDLKQLICFIGFIIAIVLDLNLIQLFISIQNILKWYFRLIIAAPIIIIALRIAKKSLKILYSEIRTPPHVIRNGPFQYSRHPMYLSALLIYISFNIATLSVIGFIYSIGIFALYSYFAHYEEKYLLIEFKEDYKEYMNQVSRWIGFPKKYM
ncbi:MAG: methyltransferase family protein [Promethearchaeota archaeon]